MERIPPPETASRRDCTAAKLLGRRPPGTRSFQVRIAVLNGSPRSAYPSRTPWDESVRGKRNLGHRPICATGLGAECGDTPLRLQSYVRGSNLIGKKVNITPLLQKGPIRNVDRSVRTTGHADRDAQGRLSPRGPSRAADRGCPGPRRDARARTGFSVSEAARRAVSALRRPYKHFKDRHEILRGVVSEAMDRLAAPRWRLVPRPIPPPPRARSKPSLPWVRPMSISPGPSRGFFRLVFGLTEGHEKRPPTFWPRAEGCFGVVVKAVAACLGLPTSDPDVQTPRPPYNACGRSSMATRS